MPGALLTGAGRGIGRATALRFAKEKIPVALASRTESELQEVKRSIEAIGGKAFVYPTDVAEPKELSSLVQRAEEELKGIDILISNAAIAPKVPIGQMTLALWHRVIDCNLTASFWLSKEVVARMLPRKKGRLIFVSSISATRPFGGFSAYAASKAGLIGMMKSLAEELKPHNIQTMVVAPGSVDTQMMRTTNPGIPADMSPEEVADAIYFLATGSRALTGSTLEIFG